MPLHQSPPWGSPFEMLELLNQGVIIKFQVYGNEGMTTLPCHLRGTYLKPRG